MADAPRNAVTTPEVPAGVAAYAATMTPSVRPFTSAYTKNMASATIGLRRWMKIPSANTRPRLAMSRMNQLLMTWAIAPELFITNAAVRNPSRTADAPPIWTPLESVLGVAPTGWPVTGCGWPYWFGRLGSLLSTVWIPFERPPSPGGLDTVYRGFTRLQQDLCRMS